MSENVKAITPLTKIISSIIIFYYLVKIKFFSLFICGCFLARKWNGLGHPLLPWNWSDWCPLVHPWSWITSVLLSCSSAERTGDLVSCSEFLNKLGDSCILLWIWKVFKPNFLSWIWNFWGLMVYPAAVCFTVKLKRLGVMVSCPEIIFLAHNLISCSAVMLQRLESLYLSLVLQWAMLGPCILPSLVFWCCNDSCPHILPRCQNDRGPRVLPWWKKQVLCFALNGKNKSCFALMLQQQGSSCFVLMLKWQGLSCHALMLQWRAFTFCHHVTMKEVLEPCLEAAILS